MAVDSQTVCSKFSLNWKIYNFKEYIELKRKKLESPHFKIRCLETTKWCLSLRTRQTFVDCCLNRLHKLDDLSDIIVTYKMYVIDENGNSHFEKSNTVTLGHNKRVIKEKTFLECDSLEERHLPNETLNLQCDLKLIVDRNRASKWNCNNHLISLSNDLMELYGMGEISDEILTFADVDYEVHNFVLNARCPQLARDIAETCHSADSDSTETSYTDSSAEQSIAISPMRALCYYRSENTRVTLNPCPVESDELCIGNRVNEIFTRSACEAAFRYIYSGVVDVNDYKIKCQLHSIACFYNLFDLREKLEDVAHTVFAVTNIVVDKVQVLFGTETFSQWAEDGFKPITRLINLTQIPYLRYLSVRFTIQKNINWGDILEISCRFIKGRFPITLKLRFNVCYADSVDKQEVFESCVTFESDMIWRPFVTMNLKRQGIYFRCIFSAFHTELKNVSKQEFLSAGDSSHGKSLLQLRWDMANALRQTRGYNFDLKLIAKGKLLKAHRTILYARSPVFREELLPKMHHENRIVHLVRKIEPDVLKKLVEYIYTGNLHLKEFSKVRELDAAAKRFGVTELVNACISSSVTNKDEEPTAL